MSYNVDYYTNIMEGIDKLNAKKDINLKGNVQAVGLRKKIHKIDLPENTRAIAVNNPYTEKVELSIRSRSPKKLDEAEQKIDKVLKNIKKEDRAPVKFKSIRLSPETIKKLQLKNNLHYLRSASYKENEKVKLDSLRDFKNRLKARYQLKEKDGALYGYVPVRAARQLRGKEVMYKDLAPDNRIRTTYKAKKIQEEGLTKAASIILDIKVGDILLGGRFKNVKTEVKEIGKDENNQPTINGKKLLSFRIDKLMPKKDKKAAQSDYVIKGEKVQGVGLRKNLHKILEEKGMKGIAVNDPNTGDVEISLRTKTDEETNKVIEELKALIKEKINVDVDFNKLEKNTPYKRVALKDSELNELNMMNNLNYLRSAFYRPEKSAELMSMDDLKNELVERYRLKRGETHLRGYVPVRAYRQLKMEEPMYSNFAPKNLIRSREEGLRMQREVLGDKKASYRYLRNDSNDPTSRLINRMSANRNYPVDKIAVSSKLYQAALKSRIAKAIEGYGTNAARVINKRGLTDDISNFVRGNRDAAFAKNIASGSYFSGGLNTPVFKNMNIRNEALNNIGNLVESSYKNIPWHLRPQIA